MSRVRKICLLGSIFVGIYALWWDRSTIHINELEQRSWIRVDFVNRMRAVEATAFREHIWVKKWSAKCYTVLHSSQPRMVHTNPPTSQGGNLAGIRTLNRFRMYAIASASCVCGARAFVLFLEFTRICSIILQLPVGSKLSYQWFLTALLVFLQVSKTFEKKTPTRVSKLCLNWMSSVKYVHTTKRMH